MAIPTIHVGCTHFARGRLQALVNCKGLFPVACVDINLDEAREGVASEELQLQDLHPGLIEDDRIQFDAFAGAISTGKDRAWLQQTTLGTWILMEACNASARAGARVDVECLRMELWSA